MPLPPKLCPQCREEYVHTATTCVHCEVPLVLEGELSPQDAGDDLPPISELICVRAAQRRANVAPETVLFVQIGVAWIVLLPLALFDPAPLIDLPPSAYLWLCVLGVGAQFFAWWAITAGIRRIPGYHGAVLLLSQPVASLLLGWWILGQSLTIGRAAGATIVVLAIALVVLRDER